VLAHENPFEWLIDSRRQAAASSKGHILLVIARHCPARGQIAILSFLLAGATMDYLTFQQLHRRGALRRTAISAIIVLIIVSCTSVFTAAQKSAKPPSAETQWPQQMSAYSGLLPELGNLT